MSNQIELEIAEYEHARNKAMDMWFIARPHIQRNTETEFIWEGGFKAAWINDEDDHK